MIRAELEIELANCSASAAAPCENTADPSPKGRSFFVIIYLEARLSHLDCPGVWGLDLTKLGTYKLI